MTDSKTDAGGVSLLPVHVLQQASEHNGGVIRFPSGRKVLLSKSDAAALRSTPVPCDGEAVPVAWRWKARGNKHWIYDPVAAWRDVHKDDPEIEWQPLYATPPARSDAPAYRMDIFEAAKRASAKCPQSAPGNRWLEAFRAELPVERCDARSVEAIAWIVVSKDNDKIRIWWRNKERAEEWAKTHNAPIIPLYANPIYTDAILPLASPPPSGVREALEKIARDQFYNEGWHPTHAAKIAQAALSQLPATDEAGRTCPNNCSGCGPNHCSSAGSVEAIARDLAECIGRYMSETDYRSRLLPSAAQFVANRGLTIPSADRGGAA